MADLIEMMFGMVGRVRPRDRWDSDPPLKGANFGGEGRRDVTYNENASSAKQNGRLFTS